MAADVAPDAELRVEVLTTPAALAALGPEWDALGDRAIAFSPTQSHFWATASWQAFARAAGKSLAIVTVRAGDRLACAWPFFVEQKSFYRRAMAMAFTGVEIGGPVVDRGVSSPLVTELAWKAIRRHVDFVSLYSIADGSEIHSIISRLQHYRAQHSHSVVWISFAGAPDWPTFLTAQISAKGRSNFRRQARVLERKGKVTFEKVEEIPERRAAMRWILKHKFTWMAANDIGNQYMASKPFQDFLEYMVADPKVVKIMLLKVDDQPIAAWINLASSSQIDGFMTTFDPLWDKYSPGLLLLLHGLEQACSQRLDFHLSTGEFDYKLRFANRRMTRWELHIATNWRGLPLAVWHRFRPQLMIVRTFIGRMRRKVLSRRPPRNRERHFLNGR